MFMLDIKVVHPKFLLQTIFGVGSGEGVYSPKCADTGSMNFVHKF